MQLSSRDQTLLQRFHDGEMTVDERAAFRARLEAEPALRAGLAGLAETSRGFCAGREAAFAPSAGFTATVLAEVRQLPSRIQLQQAEAAGGVLVLCRRLLVAAAILFGLGLCWHGGLFAGSDAATLEAASDEEIERALEQLDAKARALADTESPPAVGGVRQPR